MKENDKYNVCIMQPNDRKYSETFIKARIDHLPANVFELYGGFWIPAFARRTNKRYISQWKKDLDLFINHKYNKNINFFQSRSLKRYLRKNKIEAVLAEYGQTGEAVYQVCQKLNIPLIVGFHGFDAYRDDVMIDNFYKSRYPKMFQAATAVIAVSQDMREQLIKIGADPDKVNLVPYGIDVEKFEMTHPEKNPIKFVSVGRFVHKKAPYLTVLAFQKVVEQFPEAQLYILGEGILFEVCRRMVKSLNLESNVFLPGPASHDEVVEHLKDARGFVLHSVLSDDNDSEGTPLSVLEASSMGLPVISTRHAGIKDAVIENVTGFLVDEGDFESMADHIIDLIKDPELAKKTGAAGRQRVMKNYNLETYINNVYNVIRNAIEMDTKV